MQAATAAGPVLRVGRARRTPYKRTNLKPEYRAAILAAAARAAQSLGVPQPTAILAGHIPKLIITRTHWLLREGGVLAGVPSSKQWLPKHNATHVLRYWISKEWATLMDLGRAAARAQRRPKYQLSADTLTACIKAVTEARCGSMEEAFACCPQLVQAMQASGCGQRYLWDRMRQHDSSFKLRSLAVKRELTPMQEEARMRYAQAMLRQRALGSMASAQVKLARQVQGEGQLNPLDLGGPEAAVRDTQGPCAGLGQQGSHGP